MFREFVKLSLWNVVCQIFMVSYVVDNEDLLCWVLIVSATFVTVPFFYDSLYSHTGTHFCSYYSSIVLFAIGLPNMGIHGILHRIFVCEFLCLLCLLSYYVDLVLEIPKWQKIRARRTGCPGH